MSRGTRYDLAHPSRSKRARGDGRAPRHGTHRERCPHSRASPGRAFAPRGGAPNELTVVDSSARVRFHPFLEGTRAHVQAAYRLQPKARHGGERPVVPATAVAGRRTVCAFIGPGATLAPAGAHALRFRAGCPRAERLVQSGLVQSGLVQSGFVQSGLVQLGPGQIGGWQMRLVQMKRPLGATWRPTI